MSKKGSWLRIILSLLLAGLMVWNITYYLRKDGAMYDVFAGAFIFFAIMYLYIAGNEYQERINERNKRSSTDSHG